MKQLEHMTAELFDTLIADSRKNERRRQNYNFHETPEDPIQRFINAMEPDSYIRPHQHHSPPKGEIFVRLKGRFGVLIFDDTGKITDTYTLDEQNPGIDIRANVWHVVISLETGSVGLEIKEGPYTPFQPTDFASWAPEPGSDEVVSYLERLHRYFED